MSYRPPVEDDQPWYRQFWPWAVFSLPAIAVVAGIATYILAATDADSLVRDDYYKEGLAINQDLARVDKARELGLRADVRFDEQGQELRVTLKGEQAIQLPYLDLALVHPTRAGEDETLRLPALGGGEFAIHHAPPANVHWHITLSSPQGDWELKGRLQLPLRGRTELD